MNRFTQPTYDRSVDNDRCRTRSSPRNRSNSRGESESPTPFPDRPAALSPTTERSRRRAAARASLRSSPRRPCPRPRSSSFPPPIRPTYHSLPCTPIRDHPYPPLPRGTPHSHTRSTDRDQENHVHGDPTHCIPPPTDPAALFEITAARSAYPPRLPSPHTSSAVSKHPDTKEPCPTRVFPRNSTLSAHLLVGY